MTTKAKKKKATQCLHARNIYNEADFWIGPENWQDLSLDLKMEWLDNHHPYWMEVTEDSSEKFPPCIRRFPLINTATYEIFDDIKTFKDVERQALSNMKAMLHDMPEVFGVSAPTEDLLHVVMNHPTMKEKIEAEARKRIYHQFEEANLKLAEAWNQRNLLLQLREAYALDCCPGVLKSLIRDIVNDRDVRTEERVGYIREMVGICRPLIRKLEEIRECVAAAQLPTTLAKVDLLLNPKEEN